MLSGRAARSYGSFISMFLKDVFILKQAFRCDLGFGETGSYCIAQAGLKLPASDL